MTDQVVASEQKLATMFATSGQIQSAPDFAKWSTVDTTTP